MGPEMTMNSDSTTLAVPNWADYQPRLQNAMESKGLWRHVKGTATVPMLFAVSNEISMLNDGKMLAMEDQIESKEVKILEFEKREYLARHILLSTTLT